MKLLVFKAEWCGPCKKLGDMMENIEFPYEVVSINIDENMELAAKYNIKSIPALVLLNDTEQVKHIHIGLPTSIEKIKTEFISG